MVASRCHNSLMDHFTLGWKQWRRVIALSTSENFAVCYGFMPAKCTIFDAKKCTATYELGAGPHNTIRWNPFGRFIMLAGFGKLPGDVKFYHR